MQQIDTPLPMAVPGVTPEPEPAPEPVSRQELVNLLAQIGAQAKMPHGVKKARFVRVPSELYLRVTELVKLELASLGGLQ